MHVMVKIPESALTTESTLLALFHLLSLTPVAKQFPGGYWLRQQCAATDSCSPSQLLLSGRNLDPQVSLYLISSPGPRHSQWYSPLWPFHHNVLMRWHYPPLCTCPSHLNYLLFTGAIILYLF